MNPILWNTFDDLDSLMHGEIGSGATIVGDGIAFEMAQHGAGYVRTALEGQNDWPHVAIPGEILHGLNDAGTVEMWINPKVPNPVAYEYGVFYLFDNYFDFTNSVALFWGDEVSGRGLQGRVHFDPNVTVTTPPESHQFVATPGTPFHVALTWDVAGIDGSADTVRVYRDGAIVGAAQGVWDLSTPYYGASDIILGVGPDHQGFDKFVTDDLIIWDAAKTDFSDRFVEGPGGVLFADDFSGALSSAWEVKLASASIKDGWLHMQDTDGWPRDAVVVLNDSDPTWTDYSVRLKADFADGTPWENFALVLRADDFETSSGGHYGSGYFINFNGSAGWDSADRNQVELFRFVAPDLWNRMMIETPYVMPEDGAELIAAVEGGRVRLWADGDLLFDVTDPNPLPFGGLGLHTIWESEARFDDVLVVAASPEDAGWLSPPPPSGAAAISLGRTEAEALDVGAGFAVDASRNASGGALLKGAFGVGNRASGVFDGPEGVYAITVGHFDETDGASRMEVRVNGAVVDAWDWDGVYGDAILTPGGRAERGAFGVALKPGDVIEIAGTADGGEPLRTDWIEVAAMSAIGLGRTEAEALATAGFETRAAVNGSGGAYLQASLNGPSAAGGVFSGPAGRYDLTIGLFDESDGASAMRVLVNGVEVDAWTWDADPGGAIAAPDSRAERVIAGLDLAPGDAIELVGQRDGGEPLRTDWLEIAAATPPPPELDLLIRTDHDLFVFRNDGHGALVAAGPPTPISGVFALGDVDGDGFVDLVRAAGPTSFEVVVNDGSGVFTPSGVFELPPADAAIASDFFGPFRAAALADVDADGDLDVVALYSGGAFFGVALNDGAGAFAPHSGLFLNDSAAPSLTATDIDLDGDIDFLTPDMGDGSIFLLLNDGAGAFSRGSVQGSARDEIMKVLTPDFNADSFPDVVFEANDGGFGVMIDISDGQGLFNYKSYFWRDLGPDIDITEYYSRYTVEDFNGDRRSDIAFVHFEYLGATMDIWTDIWLNRATEGGIKTLPTAEQLGFTHVFSGQSLPGAPRFEDMDGDGDPDALVLVAAEGELAVRTFRNDGEGRFEEAETLAVIAPPSTRTVSYGFAEIDAPLSPWTVVDIDSPYI